MIGVPRVFLLGSVALCLVSLVLTHRVSEPVNCSLDYLKEVARNSCRALAKVKNNFFSPDNYRLEQMHHDMQKNRLMDRVRRHSRIHDSDGFGHHRRRYTREEPTYMKLNKRFRHESQNGYIELSYSKRIYDQLKNWAPSKNVTELTAGLLSEQGIIMESNDHDNSDSLLRSSDDSDSSMRRLSKRSEHSYDNLINKRMEPIALIAYCCIIPDSDKCKIQTCF